MSFTTRALIAAWVFAVVSARRPHASRWVRAAPLLGAWHPAAGVLALGVWPAGRALASRRRRRRRDAAANGDVVTVAELTALALAGGHSLSGSLSLAAENVCDDIRVEVDAVLRRARVSGLSAALAAHEGRCRRLFSMTSRAVETGAPVRSAVEAFVDDAIADRREADLTAARKLPVKMLFPLALLILPGFMVLAVGPALLGSLEHLDL